VLLLRLITKVLRLLVGLIVKAFFRLQEPVFEPLAAVKPRLFPPSSDFPASDHLTSESTLRSNRPLPLSLFKVVSKVPEPVSLPLKGPLQSVAVVPPSDTSLTLQVVELTTVVGESARTGVVEATGVDVVLPEVGVEATGVDVVLPEVGVEATGVDVVLPEVGVEATGADVVLPEVGVEATGADVVLPEVGVEATGADVVLPEVGVEAGVDLPLPFPFPFPLLLFADASDICVPKATVNDNKPTPI
jgi:hypothetical protein